jgi:hypothetical protein
MRQEDSGITAIPLRAAFVDTIKSSTPGRSNILFTVVFQGFGDLFCSGSLTFSPQLRILRLGLPEDGEIFLVRVTKVVLAVYSSPEGLVAFLACLLSTRR